jgi:hypothetical protein
MPRACWPVCGGCRVIDLGLITDRGVQQMTPQDVLDVRALILEAGAVNCRSSRLAQAMVEELALPDTVLVVKVISLVADASSADYHAIPSDPGSDGSLPTIQDTINRSAPGVTRVPEGEQIPMSDPVLRPAPDKYPTGPDQSIRHRTPEREPVETTLRRFDLRVLETAGGSWIATHGRVVLAHHRTKAEALHAALNNAVQQAQGG